jgi:Trp operon repressor
MPQVSKYPLSPQVEKRMFEIFVDSFRKIYSKKLALNLLNDILTPTEKIMLAKRLSIAYLLEKEYDYRSISSLLKVSLGTVARINNIRKTSGKGYKHVLKLLLNEQKVINFFDKIELSIAHTLPPKSRNWKSHYQTQKKRRHLTKSSF